MRRALAFLSLFLCLSVSAQADDTAKPAKPSREEFSKAVASAKDPAALAVLLQGQLHLVMGIALDVKDAAGLETAKASFQETAELVTLIGKRLEQLPVPAQAERQAIAKKMEDEEADYAKKQKPLIEAHMKSLPAEVRAGIMTEMRAFYKSLGTQQKVFQTYFQPDKSEDPEEKASPEKGR